MAKQLLRDCGTKQLAGVSGGLAAYFDIDITIVRILFVFTTIFVGFGFWAYIIIWIIAPMSDKPLLK